MSEIVLWREHAVESELGAGGVDPKRFEVETADEVISPVCQVQGNCPAERLWLNPDCSPGNGLTAFLIADARLRSLLEGAADVRREPAG